MATKAFILILRILLAVIGVALLAVACTDAKSPTLLYGIGGAVIVAVACMFKVRDSRRG